MKKKKKKKTLGKALHGKVKGQVTKTSGSESLGPQGHRNAKRTCRQQKEGHFKEGAECSRSDLDTSRSLSNTGEFTTHLIEISGQFYGLMPQGKPAFSPSTWSPSQGLGRLNFFFFRNLERERLTNKCPFSELNDSVRLQ